MDMDGDKNQPTTSLRNTKRQEGQTTGTDLFRVELKKRDLSWLGTLRICFFPSWSEMALVRWIYARRTCFRHNEKGYSVCWWSARRTAWKPPLEHAGGVRGS